MSTVTVGRHAQIKKARDDNGHWIVTYHHESDVGAARSFEIDWLTHEVALRQALRWVGLAS